MADVPAMRIAAAMGKLRSALLQEGHERDIRMKEILTGLYADAFRDGQETPRKGE